MAQIFFFWGGEKIDTRFSDLDGGSANKIFVGLRESGV